MEFTTDAESLLYWKTAIAADTAMKNTIKTLIMSIFFLSVISFFTICPLMRSSVRVELEVRTRDESVDMDAERTRITTIPIRISGSPESIVGMTASKPFLSTLTSKRRPKPPRK